MIWVRKLLVSLFAVLTLLALTGGVVSFALNKAFATPDHIELWLDQSKLYEHFVATSVGQATEQSQATDSSLATTLSGNDDVVQQAIQTAFPKQLISQSVRDFLNANYDWLQGKTTTPQFQIDLSTAKTQFGAEVGKAVSDHLAGLPVCTAAQLSQLQTVDLLHIECRPPGIDPSVQALEVQQQIGGSDGFLGNAVLTADTLNPKQPGAQESNPYYKQFARVPQLYQVAQKLPYAFALLALIGAVIILFAASTKRGALRLLAKIFLVAGILLAVGKLAFDIIFNKAQDRVFNTSTNGGLQQSITDFAHRAIAYVTHIDLIAGIVYLIIAAVIIISLLLTRGGRSKATAATAPSADANPAPAPASTQPLKRNRPVMDVMGPPTLPKVAPAEQTSSTPVTPAPQSAGSKARSLGRRGIIQ